MKMSVRAGALVAGCLAVAGLSFGQPVSLGQKVKMNGLITSRAGATMTVKSSTGGNVVVVLTDNSQVAESKGLLHLRKSSMAVMALVPGLKVEVEGVGDERGRVIATAVRFSADDLKAAQAIQAGLAPTDQKVQANAQGIQANQQGVQANQQQIKKVASDEADLAHRFGELGDYDTKAEATVYFGVDSTALSEKAKGDLAQLAARAKGLDGYLVEVEGFADSTGSASLNEKLSQERSQTVVDYLAQSCGISFLHMLAPGAMGTAQPAASNETAQGRAENRRVVVKVVVNRGLSQS